MTREQMVRVKFVSTISKMDNKRIINTSLMRSINCMLNK